MADKVKFAVSVTPIEDVGASQEGSASNFIAASECFGSAGGSGQVGGAATDGDKLTGLTIVTGGGANDGAGGGAGGSGIVILRIADENYSGTTTGSPTVDTSSVADETILIYTATGSYTA